MSRLSHVVAVSKGVKATSAALLTQAHQNAQKGDSLKGLNRTYQPIADGEIPKPPESTLVRYTAKQIVDEVQAGLVRLFDVTATQDYGNSVAFADVKVDGVVLVQAAPVSYLLFLEKQLVDLATFIRKLPVLDPAEAWEYDANTGHFRTPPVQTVSNKKVYRNHVKAAATERHAEQVEVYTEDVAVGHWSLVKFSGAFPATRVKELTERVTKLQEAVKVAREEANATDVADQRVGETLLGWLFG